ncbi:MAG: sigma-70 family RNA polymerase sigma factor, partial [Bacteroidota bacterium]
MNQFTDKELLEKIRRNERRYEAFEIIVRRHQEKLYSSIRRMLRNHEDTNDVIQNVFLKAWKNLDKFKGESAFYTWLYRIAYNETINFINANKKHRHVDLADTEYAQIQNSEADHIYDGDQIKRKLDAAIARLPEKQK